MSVSVLPEEKKIRVAMVGNPNTGKSALFNALTGSRVHVGNWPGVTIEKKKGFLNYEGYVFEITDLPGIYSLSAQSIDEKIARDFIIREKPDVVINVVDSTNLERNLYLTVMLLEMGANVVLTLNMTDVVIQKGIKIDIEKLSEFLGGVPIVQTIATKGEGLARLKDTILRFSNRKIEPLKIDYGREIEEAISKLEKAVGEEGSRFVAVKLLEGDTHMIEKVKNLSGDAPVRFAFMEASDIEKKLSYSIETEIVGRRYAFIEKVIDSCVEYPQRGYTSISDRIDAILTNRILGLPIFAFVMWATFQLTFTIGGVFADYVDSAVGWFSDFMVHWLTSVGASNIVVSFVGDGVISGVGTVLVFLPNIMILFLLLAFLEDSGYMARAAFVMDRVMYAVGLPGKSFIPMLIGFGCNVPAVMSARTISSERDRLLTILTNPFISCSARLPIYVMFTSILFPTYQGFIVFSLYVLGIVVAVLSAKFFKTVIPSLKGGVSPLVMELPPYRLPTLKSLAIHMWDRTGSFVKKAGTVIVAGVVVIWVLSNFPEGAEYASKDSYLGRLGGFFAPFLSPAGFGFWQAAVALFFGIIAKETVVGTFGTLFGGGEKLVAAIKMMFTPISAYSFMIMSLLYVPCIATVGVIHRETGSVKWTLFSVGYSIFIGWLAAVVFYQIGTILIGG